jgi:transcriptional regulator with GAF, ATPase, and Fis domain
MANHPKFYESNSETRPDAVASKPLPRHRVHLEWTDGTGPHRQALEALAVAGSAASVDIVVHDMLASRLHAEIEPREDGVWVRDLGSRNGTYVNGLLVREARVPLGGRVRLGATEIVLVHDEINPSPDLWPDDFFGPLVGASAAMRSLFARLGKIAPTDATVLVYGETGTGKELVARAVHEASVRRDEPFIIVDCGALPENLLEAELFGHARGAFTGATDARAGAIETANGGTVFLDEIGELPLAMQPKLLRVLESRTVRRLGDPQHRSVDVRFVAATHRDLRTMVNQGAFREDLYFRLAVVPISVPPLRERVDDIPLLVRHFLAGSASPDLDIETLQKIVSRPWLGNVRELRNFVERAKMLGAPEALAMDATSRAVKKAADDGSEALLDLSYRDARQLALEAFERTYVLGLLARHDRDTAKVARIAGLNRSYVYKLLRRYEP